YERAALLEGMEDEVAQAAFEAVTLRPGAADLIEGGFGFFGAITRIRGTVSLPATDARAQSEAVARSALRIRSGKGK
ncbi:MAG: hypothetical protein ABEL51_02675, partial [Salinibacter sp.]